MPRITAELSGVIDALYRVFAPYQRPQWFDACACCWSESASVGDGEHAGTVRVPSPGGIRPLRELTAVELSGIAETVPLTAGSLDLLKHYLPRTLELAVDEAFESLDLELVLLRLNDDERVGSMPWTRWPAGESAAVRDFLHALWRVQLADDMDEYAVDVALCGIGMIDPDIDWYLDEWLRFDSTNAAVNLERFLTLNVGRITHGHLWNEFWSLSGTPGGANVDRIIAWLRSPATKQAVAGAADRARTEAERDALTESYLRWLP